MQQDLWKIAGFLFLGLLLGIAANAHFAGLLIASFFIIGWQIYRLNKLNKWIDNPIVKAVPHADGQIYDILRKLARRDKKNKLRHRQLSGYLGQVRKAIGALPDAIVLIDDLGKIEWANNNALALLGIRWPADRGLRISDLVRFAELERLIDASEPISQGIEVASAMQRNIVLNLKCLTYTDELRMVIARDVTRLVRTNQMQRDFVANVSHELKTPLTVLRGYIEILRGQQKVPEAFAKPLEQMNAQSIRMELIVRDLLQLAKLESTPETTATDSVDIAHLVSSAVETLQPLIDEKQHRLKINADANLRVIGSAGELHSAITNLITNAIHYTPNKGVIEIYWNAFQDRAQLVVKDNGDGIESHHLERLTQRFYRVDSNRSRDRGGTGLGLAIVKHVLQRHRAKLLIESEVGEGSTFICEFDAARLQHVDSPVKQEPAQVTRIY